MDKHFLGWYLQDDWKATRKLTLNLGLSYEIQTAPTERHDKQEYFDPKAVNPISTAVGFNMPGMLVFNSSKNLEFYRISRHASALPTKQRTNRWFAGVTASSSFLLTTTKGRTPATRKVRPGLQA